MVPAPWHRGRVVLIGDAAHSCPPTLAQGGAQALEDAAVLTELLLSSAALDDELWAAFTARRYERAKTVVEASSQLGQWLLDHEQGDVPGLIATRHRAGQPARLTPDRNDEGGAPRMPDRLITHLRHIDLAVPDYGKQLDFFTGVWGLTAEHSDTGLTFLAAEGSPEQYVVRLRQADDKRIDLIAFGAASAADVDALAARLAADGVRLVSEPGALADARRRLRVPVLRQRGPHRRGQRRRRGPRAPQDRGGRVHPGPAVARGGQLGRPRRPPWPGTSGTSASRCPTPSCTRTWAR